MNPSIDYTPAVNQNPTDHKNGNAITIEEYKELTEEQRKEYAEARKKRLKSIR